MKTTVLAAAAVLALSSAAFANDFAATLHYPNETRQPAAPRQSNDVDYASTGSIVRQTAPAARKPVAGKLSLRDGHDDAVPTVSGKASGIDLNPWFFPSLR